MADMIADSTRHGEKFTGSDSKPVIAEKLEIVRLRAELARVKKRDISGRATAYFAKGAK